MAEARLDFRFSNSLRSLGIGEVPRHLLVAFSGGLDSTVLLHLLRFRCQEMPLTLTAAHLNHRMRSSSGADVAWVRGVCHAWGIPLESGEARPGLDSEEAARKARYAFLRAAARQVGADLIVTAHHADDQAETVLFRVLRGTGIHGLGGIPARTRSGLVRPLLPFWRDELEAYAVESGLRWREDPTNAIYGPVRNRLRLEIIPRLEETINPGAKQNLVRLAALARESETVSRKVLRSVYPKLVSRQGATVVVDRKALARAHPAIAGLVVRKALGGFGIVPAQGGTRAMLTFITDAPSGREIHLPGGVRIVTEFDRARIFRSVDRSVDTTARIPLPPPGEEAGVRVSLGGSDFLVRARLADGTPIPGASIRWQTRLRLSREQFPLTVRGRMPGDRLRTRAGTKSVKKLMIEERVPRGERSTRPVVVDSHGMVAWVAGSQRVAPVEPGTDTFVVDILVRDA